MLIFTVNRIRLRITIHFTGQVHLHVLGACLAIMEPIPTVDPGHDVWNCLESCIAQTVHHYTHTQLNTQVQENGPFRSTVNSQKR